MEELAKQFARLYVLRAKVDHAVECEWARGEPGKSYEGAWELCIEYPSTDEGGAKMPPCFWEITMHSYLIGPDRHYKWRGKTFEEAVTKCWKDVDLWCAIAEKEREHNV